MSKQQIKIIDLSKYLKRILNCIFQLNERKRAFEDLYMYDKHLIKIEPQNVDMQACNEKLGKHYVGERSIVFRFAHYLQNEPSKSKKFSAYHLDCEYNRSGCFSSQARFTQAYQGFAPI